MLSFLSHTLPPSPESQAYEISLAKLNALLEARTKYYENADVTIDLRGYGKDEQAGAPTAGECVWWWGTWACCEISLSPG